MTRPATPPAFFPTFLLVGALLQGCTPPEDASPARDAGEGGASVSAVEHDTIAPDTLLWDEGGIRSPEGDVLLTSEDFPGSVEVAPGATFGAGTRITAVRASPDGSRIALTTVGTAHGFGWIVSAGSGEPSLVAFQYGGTVRLEDWDPTGRYLAFVIEPPGPGTHVWVTDVEVSGEGPGERGFAVDDPRDEGAREQDGVSVELQWVETELCFVFSPGVSVEVSARAPGSGGVREWAGATREAGEMREAGDAREARDAQAEEYCVDPESRAVRVRRTK
jgi:dipeptidyl aminopeptidase/acylaminoacyl peptidase